MQAGPILLGLKFSKIADFETRPLIRNCMPKIDLERKHVLRSNGGYIPFKNLGNKFNSSFFPYHSKLWNTLPKQIQSSTIEEYKIYTHKEMKPLKCKHFSKGNKYSNTLLTKIRVGRSSLNLHKFSIGQIESPECVCHFKEESVSHFILDCFLYTLERRVLFSTFEHYIPNFLNFTKQKKLEIILNGIHVENNDFYSTNVSLTIATQNYILQTNRFTEG